MLPSLVSVAGRLVFSLVRLSSLEKTTYQHSEITRQRLFEITQLYNCISLTLTFLIHVLIKISRHVELKKKLRLHDYWESSLLRQRYYIQSKNMHFISLHNELRGCQDAGNCAKVNVTLLSRVIYSNLCDQLL